MKNLFIKVLLFVTFFVGIYSFNDAESKNEKYDFLMVVRVTTESGTTINLSPTKNDALIAVDIVTTLPSLNIPFPSNPTDQQLLGITTRANITNLNLLVTGGIPITGSATTLPAGNAIWFIYNQASDRWFKY